MRVERRYNLDNLESFLTIKTVTTIKHFGFYRGIEGGHALVLVVVTLASKCMV
jgi:hypothetical protein